jgi:hypothetical protein
MDDRTKVVGESIVDKIHVLNKTKSVKVILDLMPKEEKDSLVPYLNNLEYSTDLLEAIYKWFNLNWEDADCYDDEDFQNGDLDGLNLEHCDDEDE